MSEVKKIREKFHSCLEITFTFLRLGCTSFGGPIAHIGYFHHEFVLKKKWINDKSYSDLVALCQFLPGPASSQIGMALGYKRAGLIGAILAWIGFTLPSAFLLVGFYYGITSLVSPGFQPILHGLKLSAVVIVAQAIWSMGKKFSYDKQRASITILTCISCLLIPFSFTQIFLIFVSGTIGSFLFQEETSAIISQKNKQHGSSFNFLFLILFFVLLVLLPLAAFYFPRAEILLFDSFYRAGSLVFGGGHVVLPLLQNEMVSRHWTTNEVFMNGYGASQAIPGPLFAFAAYLGAASDILSPVWWKAGIALAAIFLPSFLLILGVLPFWESIRSNRKIQNAMFGVNASVVGILLAAFYHPIWTSSVQNVQDFSVALFGFLLILFWEIPSWAVVLLSVVTSYGFYLSRY
ncbi:chromate efflux transporter [Leptospira ilyithenensis]|uniref:Chromate efflux transporter n=1 Tax=Leptospira ilyithenensis TaxID=2484901 RepID=A0A4R9LJH6_9LEPT|nr:chromate efflux transporter [Leptospira ilyithenensis]TGN07037.1 chromate efflux transporter [Leptospira ilyithenensis]